MKQAEIKSAFVQAIESIPDLPERFYRNVEKGSCGTVNPKKTHLRIVVNPVGSQPETLGCDKWIGFLQVNVYVRDKTGTDDAEVIADKIIDSFPKGSKISYNDTTVQINTYGWISPGIDIKSWYVVPVTIPYEGIKK